ncbi:esterase YqiA [Salinivibrio socompensis]|uniref:esterase YqiA n=1 Tax=Salinivibrio socompensis TaxID=1510206 RepID=UPI0030B85A82
MASALLYLHGFNSSPDSLKARQMREYCHRHRPDIEVLVPQLPSHPAPTIHLLTELVDTYGATHQLGLVGSSLGGFLATWLSERYQLPAVLVNPAVRPYELLQDYIGEQVNPYTQERYCLDAADIGALRELDVPSLSEPARIWLLQQMGDEVLDYRQAVDKFSASKQTVEPMAIIALLALSATVRRYFNFSAYNSPPCQCLSAKKLLPSGCLRRQSSRMAVHRNSWQSGAALDKRIPLADHVITFIKLIDYDRTKL